MRMLSTTVICCTVVASTALAQVQTGSVNVGDASINYEITGRGQTVVLVHGWANTLAIWDTIVPALSRQYRVLRYDRRGFGKSTGYADGSADPDDLRILLDSLRIRSAYVVGLSAGSNVATRFAVAFPDRIDALVRISGPAPEGLVIAAAQERGPDTRAEIARKHGLDSLGKVIYARLGWLPPGSTDADRRRDLEAFQKLWSSYSGRDLLDPRPQSGRVPPARWDKIHDLKVPTLLVNGDHDGLVPLEVADSLARRLPNARKVVLPNAGHAAHLRQPELFVRTLRDFFSSLER